MLNSRTALYGLAIIQNSVESYSWTHGVIGRECIIEYAAQFQTYQTAPVAAPTIAIWTSKVPRNGRPRYNQFLGNVCLRETVPQVALEKIHGLKAFHGLDAPETLQFFEVHSVLDEDHSEREAQGIVSQTYREL